jgi:hypothetical protein
MTTGVICTPPVLQFTLNNGQLAAGGSILTQVGGVNTATYADSGLTTPLPNPIPLNSRGEVSNASGASSQLFLTPNTVYTFTLSDASGNQVWQASYVNGVQLSGSAAAAALNPITNVAVLNSLLQTAAETAAGVTPINYTYAPGMVDRYGTNTTPGTTDMTIAIQRAISVATASANLGTGGVVTFLSATYLFTSLTMATNVQLVGQGPLATILTTATAGNGIAMTSPINQAQGVRTEVRDLQIICTNGSNTGGGYVDVAGTLVRLRNVRIQGFAYNVIFDQTELGLIERCDLEQPLTASLWLVNGPDHTPLASTGFTNRITVRDCEFNSSVVASVAVIDDGGTSHTFHDNNFNGYAQHFRIAACTNLVIRDSEFESNTGYTFVFSNTTNKGTSVGVSPIVTIQNNFFSPPSNQLANVTASSLTGLSYICNRSITSAACISGTSGINTVFAYGNLDSNIGTIFDGIAPNHFETAVAKGSFIISDNILSQSRIGFSGVTPAAVQTGFGTPTGAALLANFPGSTATLAQTSGMLAELLTILLGNGIIKA